MMWVSAVAIWGGVARLAISRQCVPLGATHRAARAKVDFASAIQDGAEEPVQSACVLTPVGDTVFAKTVIAFAEMAGMEMNAKSASRDKDLSHRHGRLPLHDKHGQQWRLHNCGHRPLTLAALDRPLDR